MFDWDRDMRPVLDATYVALQNAAAGRTGGKFVDIDGPEIAAILGEENRSGLALKLRELQLASYIECEWLAGPELPVMVRLTEKSYRLVAGWPSGAADAAVSKMLAILELRIAEAESEDERTRWQRVRAGLLSFGRDSLVEVVGAAGGHTIGA